MKQMHCPMNGLRNIAEFVFGGDVHPMPGPNCSDAEWTDYVFYHDNSQGVVKEWWLHQASGYWFIAERNRTTDEILRTYDASGLYSSPVYFAGEENTL